MMIQKLKEAVSFIQNNTQFKPDVGITLGSGLANFANQVEIEETISFSDIPHFSPPSVDGHPGKLILGTLGSTKLAILQGRIHYYEGHSPQEVVFPTRLLGLLGIQHLILTNAAGGIDPQMKPGHFMIIDDHINLTGTSPLIGKNYDELGPRFPDMTEVYDRELSNRLEQILKNKNIPHSRGIYCGVSGPAYETAAEVRYLQKIGGHAVGMSTVPEAIAARHMGLKLTGVSCITNLATGLSASKVTHEEVKEIAARVESQFLDFLTDFVKSL